eukprot:CAMPEP_0114659348 /NCGR_PEP_ID=MMETSP0191-20121206/17655_1 /TAXON_ID=126664 /ORGANISM="Sorites sp." /LENGTH=158 /DNA_ID=CAMNT_0001884275 /DNA_START=558 /DNA_END=1031 /DNA_ORIENTATION=+
MTAGNVQQSGDMSGVLSEEKMEIPINYDDNDFDDGKSFLYAGNKLQDGTLMDEGFVRKFNVANTQSGSMDDVMNKAQNRLYKLQNVKESKEAQIRHESGKMKLGAFPPNVNNDYVESMKVFNLLMISQLDSWKDLQIENGILWKGEQKRMNNRENDEG